MKGFLNVEMIRVPYLIGIKAKNLSTR